MNTTKQAGGALGLAATVSVTAGGNATPGALTAGYSRAFRILALILTVAACTAVAIPGRRDAPMRDHGHTGRSAG